MRLAIYPGSFDPITNGHIDIIRRASVLFDHLVVALLRNPSKKPCFSIEQRLLFLTQAIKDMPNVTVDSFDGLLVEYAAHRQARVLVRGIRALTDFEYEFQMALMNRRLAPDLETIYLVPSAKYSYLSSRLVKEVAGFGGSVTYLVPEPVEHALQRRFSCRHG